MQFFRRWQPPKIISFDLDDTLYDNVPVMQTAEHGTDHSDFQTCSTAVLCTLTNIGPGLGEVGPTGNYSGFGSISKSGMVVLMAMGRLEIMGLIALLTPGFWRRS